MSAILAENRLSNPNLNAEFHLRPIMEQSIEIYRTTRLKEDTFYASSSAILATLEDGLDQQM